MEGIPCQGIVSSNFSEHAQLDDYALFDATLPLNLHFLVGTTNAIIFTIYLKIVLESVGIFFGNPLLPPISRIAQIKKCSSTQLFCFCFVFVLFCFVFILLFCFVLFFTKLFCCENQCELQIIRYITGLDGVSGKRFKNKLKQLKF